MMNAGIFLLEKGMKGWYGACHEIFGPLKTCRWGPTPLQNRLKLGLG